ncbi:MAG: hypothetical protein WCS85_03310 [Candidatus Peribacteraceae bacterium]|jgi:hypothetical protein
MHDAPPPSTIAELLQRPAVVVLQDEVPDQGICMSSGMMLDDALTLDDLASFTPKQREFYLLVAGFRHRYSVRCWDVAREQLASKPKNDAIFALTPQLQHNRVAINDAIQPPREGLHPSDVVGVDLLHEGEKWRQEEFARERQALKKALEKFKEDAKKKKEKLAQERQAGEHEDRPAEKKGWY